MAENSSQAEGLVFELHGLSCAIHFMFSEILFQGLV